MTTASAYDLSGPVNPTAVAVALSGAAACKGSEYAWALAFFMPYVAVFLAFVVYPVGYGMWLGSKPSLYARPVLRPDLSSTIVNTLLVPRHRRQREDVPGAVAVGLLHAPGLVGQRAC